MNKFLEIYQHLPEFINPNISFGFFSVSWYSIMYIVAFAVVYFLVKYRIIKREYEGLKIPNSKFQIPNKSKYPKSQYQNLLLDFLLYAFVGLIIGARLGEVLFYNFSYYMADPMRIISPFDSVTGEFMGIYGMSYHGGLIGVVLAAWIWAKRNKTSLSGWANFIVPAIPAGYFFGRIGNFINNELYGRLTDKWWGMYFSDDPRRLRHPSQFYEAFLEGILLFIILWVLRNNKWARKYMLIFYLIGYALARIVAEFFREPEGFIGFFTTGQFLSLLMVVAAFVLFIILKNSDIIRAEE